MAHTQTIVNDFNAGKKDKKAGYYDKWYRYNRTDDGKAYDDGFKSVETKNKYGVTIIECVHN